MALGISCGCPMKEYLKFCFSVCSQPKDSSNNRIEERSRSVSCRIQWQAMIVALSHIYHIQYRGGKRITVYKWICENTDLICPHYHELNYESTVQYVFNIIYLWHFQKIVPQNYLICTTYFINYSVPSFIIIVSMGYIL